MHPVTIRWGRSSEKGRRLTLAATLYRFEPMLYSVTVNEPVLRLTSLAKVLPGGRRLFDGLTLTLEAGEHVAIRGESGAGKSTLLNHIQPGLKLKVGKVSKYWATGKHTTSAAQMYRLDMGGYVIDTPGVRTFRTFGITPSNLRDLFPDFIPFQARCKFPDCTHDHEPGCAVFDAVESREIAASRYASYVEMLDDVRKTTPEEADETIDE